MVKLYVVRPFGLNLALKLSAVVIFEPGGVKIRKGFGGHGRRRGLGFPATLTHGRVENT